MAITASAGRTFSISNSAVNVINGIISESGSRELLKTGTGTLQLTGDNSYSAGLHVQAGTAQVLNIRNATQTSNVGTAAIVLLGHQIATGTLEYQGVGESTNRQIQIGNGAASGQVGGARILSSGSGALTFSNANFNQTTSTGANATSRTLTLGGSNSGTNTISGIIQNNTNTLGDPLQLSHVSVTKEDAGTWILSGSNTFTGSTTISGGVLQLGDGGTSGSLSTNSAITNNAILRFNRSNTMTQGTHFSSAGIGGSGQIQQNGSGTVVLNAVNTYTGATTVNAGTLLVSSGSINSTSGVTVNSGGTLSYSSSTGLNRNVTLNTGGTFVHNGSTNYTGTLTWNGGTLAGTNFSGVNLTVGANKTLSPGNSPGTMTSGNQTWANGGNYNLQIFDLSLAKGTGFDTIAITGTLDLTGLSIGGFNINLWSLSSIGPDVNGDALGFNNLASGSWEILSTTGGISGFNADLFSINITSFNGTAGFSNDLGGGSFSISQVGNSLYLEFAPIPEPSTWLLVTAGLCAVVFLRRRKSVR